MAQKPGLRVSKWLPGLLSSTLTKQIGIMPQKRWWSVWDVEKLSHGGTLSFLPGSLGPDKQAVT
jgi:hypothetical protein